MGAFQQVYAIFFITHMVALSSGASIVTFIFGDSLTEVGNNNYLQMSLAKSNFPYYGVDYEGGMATGRFTNGRTIGDIICKIKNSSIIWQKWVLQPYKYDHVIGFSWLLCQIAAEKLGIPSPPPFLSLSLNDDAILKGINYASGGAGILNDTGLYFVNS